MHIESDAIDSLRQLLGVHRRTIGFLEIQRAQFGTFIPPYIWHQFENTRSEIARIKQELSALGVPVADLPGDGAAPSLGVPAASSPNGGLLLTYQRMLIDQVRYLSLAGISRWSDVHLELAATYVERSLAPIGGMLAHGEPVAPAVEYAPALAGLALPAGARILLEGAPGSGKTTCLRMLTLACASRAMGQPANGAELLAGLPDPPPLPLLLTASEIALALVRSNAPLEGGQVPTLATFWSAIELWLGASGLQELVPAIQQLLEAGRCLVLLDRLDDLPPLISRPALMAAVGRFVVRYPDNRYVFACRSFDIDAMAPLLGFTRYGLAPLDQKQQETMIGRWYMAVAEHIGLLTPEVVAERIAALRSTVQGDKRLRKLASEPLSLVLCILAHAEGHAMPAERGVVLRRLAGVLLDGWDNGPATGALTMLDGSGAGPIATPHDRLALLEPMALALQSLPSSGNDQPAALRFDQLDPLLREHLAARNGAQPTMFEHIIPHLLAGCCRHGLLARVADGAYTMPHGPVREYLAACALAARSDVPARAYALRNDRRWRETLLLAMQELSRKHMPHVARLFVRLLLHPPEGAHDLWPQDMLFAAECLLEITGSSRSNNALRREVRDWLVEFVGAGTGAVSERIRAGLLLGRLGDNRFEQLMPPLVQISAGSFLLGAQEGYEDEGPEQWIGVRDFLIGMHPVTNQQYAAFLADNPGYPRPRYWHDPRFNNPACPVVGVTWHDAVAYCDWLGKRLALGGLLDSGMVVRLPLEIEWEKAASWDARHKIKRRYPWGDNWDSAYANTLDGRGDWVTAPVGCYPDGVSPYGVQDCLGNIWEWTASVYANYPGAALPFHEAGSYTLRGSSCASNPTHARCTYRSRLPANHWRYHLGFRIVIGQRLEMSAT
jgi:formylglycine-generating enzyme required for sulfatase activity